MVGKQASALLAILVLTSLVVHQIHCDEDQGDVGSRTEAQVGSLTDAVNNYLDLVPTSHKTLALAKHLIGFLQPSEKKEQSNKHSSSFRNVVEKILESIDSKWKKACECAECFQKECPNCGPATSLEDCSCPLCPLPDGCKPKKTGEDCPPPQVCSCSQDGKQLVPHHPSSLGNSTNKLDSTGCDNQEEQLVERCKKKTTKRPKRPKKPKKPKTTTKRPKITTRKPNVKPIRPKTTTKIPETTTEIPETTTTKPIVASTSKSPPTSPRPTSKPILTTPAGESAEYPDYGGEELRLANGKNCNDPEGGIGCPEGADGPKSTKAPHSPAIESTKLPETNMSPANTTNLPTTSSGSKSIESASTKVSGSDETKSASEAQSLKNASVSGQQFFEENFSSLIKDEKTRFAILRMIDSIPIKTGGRETQLASSIIANFGESLPTSIKSDREGDRNLTYGNSKENFKTIMGHLFERELRKRCKCKTCVRDCGSNFCNIDELAKKENIDRPICPTNPLTNCRPCPKNPLCPKPIDCPHVDPCPACTQNDDFNDDGQDALDDVDPRDPVQELEKNSCTGFTCEFEKTCGAANLNPLTPKGGQAGYMNGGEDEIYGEWPQFARVNIRHDGVGSLCGGVLISNRHVLTAAHCVHTQKGDKLSSDTIKVKLAEHDKKKKDEFEEEIKVAAICGSSKFAIKQDLSPKFDFSILTLDQNVTFNDHIQPACLPYNESIPSHKCFVVGMGITKFDRLGGNHTVAGIVQKMPLKRASCKNWGVKHDDRSRWCFTKAGGAGDSCSGDSGGPVLCLSKTKRWTIMGLVSYGQEACDGTESFGWVGVYTRIPAILKYIQKDCKI